MSLLLNLVRSRIPRSGGDPRILGTGPSSLRPADRLGRALGWFSIGLGLTELFAPRCVTHTLGMQGSEGLVRAYGVREIGSGMMSLSTEKQAGLWSRVGGDGMDMLTLISAYRADNPKRRNVGLALVLVAGITMLDVVGAQSTTEMQKRTRGGRRDYSDRSGFPKGPPKIRRNPKPASAEMKSSAA
ncbi:MAG: hypothetical protein AB7H77_00455 [Bdellovibrionales bacterium]